MKNERRKKKAENSEIYTSNEKVRKFICVQITRKEERQQTPNKNHRNILCVFE